jgi:predicted AAA+ superfamily ATPase
MKIFKRETYLRKIRGFYSDTGLIKVITGVRRCGKSCLMVSIAEELRHGGIDEAHIVFLDLDRRPYRKVKTADRLEELIDEKSPKSGIVYLFIDEIQNVAGFEEVVNAFRTEERFSIFITGSNSYLLSGELATKLTGRYIEFEMFPLNFAETLAMKGFLGKQIADSLGEEFERHLRLGGFPGAIGFANDEDRLVYVESVVEEIFRKDIRRRVKVRNPSVFKTVQTYLLNNYGATTSFTNILSDLEKNGMRITRETLVRYVDILKDAKILYECERFDLKSRKSLNGEKKFYLADLGFFFATNVDNRVNFGPALENVVFTYLKSEGFRVSIGRIGKLECDFIVRRHNDYAYIQVAMSVAAKETEDREYAPFGMIRDNYPKILLTLDPLRQQRDGIRHLNLIDVLTGRTPLLP